MDIYENIEDNNVINVNNNNINTLKIHKSLKLYKFPKIVCDPSRLVQLYINDTRINNLDNLIITDFINLESLSLKNNYLKEFSKELPNKLTYLDLSYNQLVSVIIDAINLESLNLSCNFLTSIPNCLLDIGPRVMIDYSYNNFEFIKYRAVVHHRNNIELPQIVNNNEKQHNALLNAYNHRIKTSTNVHETEIQKVTSKAIIKLYDILENLNINIIELDNIDNIIKYYKNNISILDHITHFITSNNTNILVIKTIKNLLNNNYQYIYDYKNNKTVTYREILNILWYYINNIENEYKISFMENLKIQILDGIEYCEVGKLTRIVNSLVGVTNILTYEIPINIKISDKAIEIKNKFKELYIEGSDEYEIECKKELELYLDKLSISPEEKLVWLDSF